MPLLGVNIDHVATLRQARRTLYPDPIELSKVALQSGADYITFHLREDRRHINESDCEGIIALQPRSNMELAPSQEMIDIALNLHPSDCCIVPEKRQELTTEGGLDIASIPDIAYKIKLLSDAGIETSLFIDPDKKSVTLAKESGVHCIEIHSGRYANSPTKQELQSIINTVQFARTLNLKVNIGHGLTQDLLPRLAKIEGISEFNIGHAIISESLKWGLAETVGKYKKAIVSP